MNAALEGWYVDPSTGTNLRFWNGTTWTDDVAPLPPVAPDPVTLLNDTAPSTAATSTATRSATPASTAPDSTAIRRGRRSKDEPIVEDPPATAEAQDGSLEGGLDPDLELTFLTRRELRLRRGEEPAPDDTPKHLPPITFPAAAPGKAEVDHENVEPTIFAPQELAPQEFDPQELAPQGFTPPATTPQEPALRAPSRRKTKPNDGKPRAEGVDVDLDAHATVEPVAARPSPAQPGAADPSAIESVDAFENLVHAAPAGVDDAVTDTGVDAPEMEDNPGRSRRIVRMSVLLAVLAFASTVAVLTAGSF